MKKNLVLLGTITSVIMLLIIPSVPAVHYNVTIESFKTKMINAVNEKDFNNIEQKLKGITNPILQEKIKKINFEGLKQKIRSLQSNAFVIDFANIYMLILCLLITIFIGKPSLGRMFFNIVTIQEIFYEFRTGELIPRCPKFYAGMIGLPILALGALLYRILQNKALGVLILVLSNIIYLILMAFASFAMESTTTTG